MTSVSSAGKCMFSPQPVVPIGTHSCRVLCVCPMCNTCMISLPPSLPLPSPSASTKQEMMKYMQEQRMPWVALAFDSVAADKLRTDYQ